MTSFLGFEGNVLYGFQYAVSDCHVESTSKIVILTESEPFFARLSELVGSGSWTVVRATTSNLDGDLIIVEGTAQNAALLASTRKPNVPLVVIGSEPLTALQPTVWLPELSGREAVIRNILDHLVPQSTPINWRRKADMIIGHSDATKQLRRSLDQLAPAASPVLITGESGVGKELVAQALHYCGPRAARPFVVINCAAIPETLFESELFGYHKGAFTGAVSSRDGAFVAADRGTLFLDEIGEMPLAAQSKLLRVLESGEVQPVGSTDRRKVTVRLVTATNRNLEAEVAQGRFREDLFYRIYVVPVHVAPLRDRPEDLTAIATHHISLIAAREQRLNLRLTPAAIDKLFTHSFPGNVRELVNVLERAVLSAGASSIDAEHIIFPQQSVGARPMPVGTLVPYRDAKQRFERDYFTRLLQFAGGNVAHAARIGKKTRKEIYDVLERLGIDAGDYRKTADDKATPSDS